MAEEKEKNRLIYIEPNDLPRLYGNKFSKNITEDKKGNIFWNQEDLNFSLDLKAIVPTRNYTGKKYDEEISDMYAISVSKNEYDTGEKKYKSFFEGISLKQNDITYLTTDYCNISYSEIREGKASAKDTLGITSVNISFSDQFYPTVEITFVDVRGYSLMMPEEENYRRKNNKEEPFKKFYSTLFHFPYPRYLLTVSGYYGTNVTFTLSVDNMKTRFNSESGNFEVTVTFKGNMFGLYADFPLSLLIVAPYIGGYSKDNTVTNNEWQNGIEGKRYIYNDSKTKMLTFIEFKKKYDEFYKTIGNDKENKSIKEYNDFKDNIINPYNGLIDSFNTTLDSILVNWIEKIPTNKEIIYIFEKEVKSSTVQEKINNFYYQSINYIKELKTNVQNCAYITNEELLKNNLINFLPDASGVTYNNIKIGKIEKDTKLNTQKNINNYIGKYYLIFTDENYYKYTENNGKLKIILSKLEKKSNEEINNKAIEYLGFDPSLENIFRMIYAHMDCFMRQFYYLLDSISGRTIAQIASAEGKDKIFLKDFRYTDIQGKCEPGKSKLPPFPSFYRKVNGERILKRPTNENEYKNLSEYDFVVDIINSITSLDKVTEATNNDKETVKEGKDTNHELKVSRDITLNMYLTLKMLYDKWLNSFTIDKFALKTPEEDKKIREERFSGGRYKNGNYTEFNNFLFIDTFYNDISSSFKINPRILYDLLMRPIERDMKSANSVIEFFTELASKNELSFHSFPLYSNFMNMRNFEKIFLPNNLQVQEDGIGNVYILMYKNETSKHLENTGKDSEINFDDDGFMLLNAEKVEVNNVFNNKDGELNIKVPSFGVTYGLQNQSYFSNISVTIDNPRISDFGIYNTLEISSVGSGGNNSPKGQPYTIAQDLYPILSSRSVKCDVEMLGCMNIMPYMLFQLNNIPLYKGAYLITKVSHYIKPGEMKTKFSGVRLTKDSIPLNSNIVNVAALNKRQNEEKLEDESNQ